MTTKNTKTASLEALRQMADRGETRPATQGDPNGLPDDFWDDAEIRQPTVKKQVNLRVDPDIIDYFKEEGTGHLTRMHSVLRAYVDAQRKKRA